MELNEFDILDSRARAKRARYPIAGGHVGIRRVLKDMPQAAGCKQHGPRFNRHRLGRGMFKSENAKNLAIPHQQISHGGKSTERDTVRKPGTPPKRSHNLASGGIAMRMQHAIAAVSTFAGECELGSGSIESRSPLN